MLNVKNVFGIFGYEEVAWLLGYHFKDIHNPVQQTSLLSLACRWYNEVCGNDSSIYSSILENVLLFDFVDDSEVGEALYAVVLDMIPVGSFFASHLDVLTDQSLMVIVASLVQELMDMSDGARCNYRFLTA